MVGGFQSVVILRLSQPSLAGVGAGAELGKIYQTRKCVGLDYHTFLMSESGLLMIKPVQFWDISSIYVCI